MKIPNEDEGKKKEWDWEIDVYEMKRTGIPSHDI
jgi:hypothetical protein